ncbi:glycosyl hydrolase family 25 protein (macronuclear) [Tetrahymena thermophila SB210]|uniref:Glycosyl hydrolase family 25 protein n=1 Tax=Tetrahymena thermophila (strain SB210) TaxID=312017 RepID=Q24BS4_TETTS|nr:glycosyl hydrolase family 25 protein [Tetrahymena thermophila SB210]EAS05234.1 glycosyl hydrolase family 25 protein [Tetrahymena thermophila SB210]|eukprot:XP_001025479.1 glycosyl hydrolase family 25 protein [Tetrahymena thermophila SB210]
MKFFAKLIILSVVASAVFCNFGIDIATLFNNYQCFVDNGYDLAIIRAYRSLGLVDANANTNLLNARAAGMDTDVYMFPCINDSKITAEQQVDDMINNLSLISSEDEGDAYDTIWVDVETNPSTTCSWNNISSVQDRCNYLQRIVNQILYRGKKVGIYASHYMWVQIFGDDKNCQNFNQLPLWYARYNNVTSTSDYSQYPFGGWTSAYAKQYAGSVSLCNVTVDLDYYN